MLDRRRLRGAVEVRRIRRRLVVPVALLAAYALHVCAAATPCSSDSDCVQIPDTYCVLGRCAIQIDAGRFCRESLECASFATLGDAACSGTCGVEALCDDRSSHNPLLPRDTGRCCLGSPGNSTCSHARSAGLTGPPALAQCAEGLYCGNQNVCVEAASAGKNWIIGVCISVLGSVVLNVGLNLQKFAYKANQAMEEEDKLPLYKMPFWLFGFGLFIVGNIANFVALNYAAQSLITPLGAVGLVSNAVAAPLINKEPFGRGDIFSIIFIVAGSVMVVVFSSHKERSYSLCALITFYQTPETVSLLTTMLALIAGIWLFIKITEVNRLPPRLPGRQAKSRLTINTGMSMPSLLPVTPLSANAPCAIGADATVDAAASSRRPPEPDLAPEDDTIWRRWHAKWHHFLSQRPFDRLFFIPSLTIENEGLAVRWLLPFSYATMGGIIGSLTVLFAKSSALLVAKTFSGESQFGNWFTYIILFAMVVTSVGQVYYINLGLQNYDALLQVPVYYVVWTIFGIVCGGVYFVEFEDFDVRQATFFFLGIFCVFVGVSFLANRLKEAAVDDLDSREDGAAPAPGTPGVGAARNRRLSPIHPSATKSVADSPNKAADRKGDGQSVVDSTILKLAKVDRGADLFDDHVTLPGVVTNPTEPAERGNLNPVRTSAQLHM